MSWLKLFLHDLRCGLLRWRYLAVPVLFVFYCVSCMLMLNQRELPGTWIDYLMYCFDGSELPDYNSGVLYFAVPVLWLLSVGMCLFLNLDYFLQDLSLSGQQVLIRCGSRVKWFLSKAAWNLCSTVWYFLLIGAMALVFTLARGGALSTAPTGELAMRVLEIFDFEVIRLTAWQGFVICLLLPFLTVATLNMLEMALCLFLPPVVSFISCIAVLMLSVYVQSPFILGNGAMAMRSAYVIEGGVDPLWAGVTAVAILFVSVIAGALRFRQMDILNQED